ncbi:MAG TPA: hypothetical protein VFQ13_21745, partial [Anaerolineales bacterium]|nr:hypothetical protein [Anaerolineales bacterium]
MLLQYWFVLETIGIILIFALSLLWIMRSVKRRKANPLPVPKSIGGKIYFYLFYLLRTVGVGVVAFLAVALFVMIDRNIYSVITETAPAPSEVTVPPDLPFDVEEVTFEGGDDLRMTGWKVPSQNGATVILLHGYGGNRT